jgi:catechol 2,3-dioxygenase-like lactoylglutathione lyase family enzyme
MLGRAQLVGFVAVRDLDTAERFYGGVLGLELVDARPFALVHDGPAGRLRITAVAQVRPAVHTVLGWVVADLDGAVERLGAAGVAFCRYDGMSQDARGIWTAPDGARVAWFLDPDGNTLSLQQAIGALAATT